MKPIRIGDRGAAVEDVQRRLLVLGYDLGPTRVDGVFFGRTAEAVSQFQSAHSLHEDGMVGEFTWAALVDATFRLGDRTLYLKIPYFHGRDVSELQTALNVLGFTCGANDGIFGAFTERAVKEFQRNIGLPADGIAGDETMSSVHALRHVWSDRDPAAHSAARAEPARMARALMDVRVTTCWTDDATRDIAERIANLAQATAEGTLIEVAPAESGSSGEGLRLTLSSSPPAHVAGGTPVVSGAALIASGNPMVAATAVSRPAARDIIIDLSAVPLDSEVDRQRAAVAVLDAVCRAIC